MMTSYGQVDDALNPDGGSSPIQLPQGLVFAILDDNKLVRMNTLRLLRKDPIFCSGESFAFGADIEESSRFARLITETRVDVAIFDQNLDYVTADGTTVREYGAEVARLAKEVYGFEGVMVLHSANEALADTFETGLFDGFIEKTASKQAFIAGLSAAWAAHSIDSKRRRGSSLTSVQACIS